MADELLIPFALDNEEKLHSPYEARKGVNYYCPGCHDPLIFRKGEIKTAHFAHKTSLTCTNESITHKIAKRLVQQVIRDWKAGKGEKPKAQRICLECERNFKQVLPNIIDDAILEYRLPEGFIVDVALMSMGEVKAAIEIKVTHAVDENKHNLLSIPYLELEGSQVIESPLIWEVITDKLKFQFCSKKCEQIHSKRLEQEKLQQQLLEQKLLQERLQQEELNYWHDLMSEGKAWFKELFGDEIERAELIEQARLQRLKDEALQRQLELEQRQREKHEREYLEQRQLERKQLREQIWQKNQQKRQQHEQKRLKQWSRLMGVKQPPTEIDNQRIAEGFRKMEQWLMGELPNEQTKQTNDMLDTDDDLIAMARALASGK